MKTKAIIISLGVPERLKLIRDVLENEYDVNIYISDFSHAKKEYIRSLDKECNYIHVPSYSKNISFRRIWSYIHFARRVDKLLETKKPKLIYVMLPPNIIADRCRKYKAKNEDTILIADLYDLWPESLPIKKLNLFLNWSMKLWKRIRMRTLESADLVFTECNYYKKVLGNEILSPEKSSVLYIHKDQSEKIYRKVVNSINNYHIKEGKITFGYLGGINNIIDIVGIQELMEQLIGLNYKITVKIIGDGEGRKKFISSLEKVGVIVEYFGIVFDEESKANILCSCDYALNMMVDNIVVGLTTKSVDYLSLGLPLLNNIKEDTWNLVEREKIGINYSGEIHEIEKKLVESTIKQEKRNALNCFNTMMTSSSLKNHVREEFIKHGIVASK